MAIFLQMNDQWCKTTFKYDRTLGTKRMFAQITVEYSSSDLMQPSTIEVKIAVFHDSLSPLTADLIDLSAVEVHDDGRGNECHY
jgi:hypothetical protein